MPHRKDFEVKPGDRTRIDVAGPLVVSLTLSIPRRDHQALPAIAVLSEEVGFEITIDSVTRTETRHDDGVQVDHYRIDVDWSPGADVSGGVVQVGFPDAEAAEVELFMVY